MLLNLFGGQNEGILFGVFVIIIVLFLIVDLGLFHKKHQKVSQKEAIQQSTFWVLVSVGYGILIYFYGENPKSALEFFSAYVTEKALSVDNIFVILLILRYFNVKEEYYHNVLFWGILGAIVFRAVFIFVGALLISEFHWILYVFGVFLVYSGIKLFSGEEDMEIKPEKNPLVKAAKKVLPMSISDKGGKFWLRENGKLLFTPLFLVIILIESTDLIFAVDSIPAAFAITRNEFVIYTSNIFAVMGLRAMFFLLANVLDKFYLLQKGLSVVLIFIGAKMLAEIIGVHVPTFLSFGVIIGALAVAIVLSLMFPKDEKDEEEPEIIEENLSAE